MGVAGCFSGLLSSVVRKAVYIVVLLHALAVMRGWSTVRSVLVATATDGASVFGMACFFAASCCVGLQPGDSLAECDCAAEQGEVASPRHHHECHEKDADPCQQPEKVCLRVFKEPRSKRESEEHDNRNNHHLKEIAKK